MTIRKLAILLFATIVLASSCQTVDTAPDYSDSSYWAYYGEGNADGVDLFMVCPCVDMGGDGRLNMMLSDEDAKSSFVGALNMERGIYDEVAIMYAPFYRQMTFPVFEQGISTSGRHFEIAYGDVEAAFLCFLEEICPDGPFILAGFSQGSQLIINLLKDYFDDPSLQDRLIAAYCIGWRITEEELGEYPHLKMAQGEDDTGVIISFNSESVESTGSIIVPEGMRTIGINPLNWQTDSAFADKSLNKGACFTDYSGAIVDEKPNLTGAYLDPERGTLKAVDIVPEDYSNSLFPDGIYHLDDYLFFYRNLQENVEVRTAAWFSN